MRILGVVVVAAVLVLYLAGQRHNPPGFAIDESSIAYNALTLARDGVDEHGHRYPLYFRAFGEYKNGPYIYLLAGVFRLVEPENLPARRLSAVLGFLFALAMAWLGWKISGRWAMALLALLIAALTPAMFEISRLAYEVALFPLAVALFLVAARTAYDRRQWSAALAAALVVTLALVTYSYTIGRMLGPVFAVLLVLFATRERMRSLLAVWVLYAALLVPMLVVNERSGGVLLHRRDVVVAGETIGDRLPQIAKNYLLNLEPLGFALRGDEDAVNHVQRSGGSMLLMTVVLALIAAVRNARQRWTWFLVLAALAAAVPVSMTIHRYHSLRLSGYVVLLLALGISAVELLGRRDVSRWWRGLVALALVAGAVQAGWFFYVFHRDGRSRRFDFHVGAREVIRDALAQTQRPIYMRPGPGYVHAYWYAALEGVDRSAFAALPPDAPAPHDSIVLAGTTPPPDSFPISRHGRFGVYYVP